MSNGIVNGRVALFPLHTVLFPDCTLALQIFEQRYLRLVKDCLRDGHGFVVVLISEGREVGTAPEIFATGCYVDVIDWNTLNNGLLGITVRATRRVHITQPGAQHDGLLTADAADVFDEALTPVTADDFSDLVDVLKNLVQHPYVSAQQLQCHYHDCEDVCNKLAYLLPVANTLKQTVLESASLHARMARLRDLIQHLQN